MRPTTTMPLFLVTSTSSLASYAQMLDFPSSSVVRLWVWVGLGVCGVCGQSSQSSGWSVHTGHRSPFLLCSRTLSASACCCRRSACGRPRRWRSWSTAAPPPS